jgi:hypothetical protein
MSIERDHCGEVCHDKREIRISDHEPLPWRGWKSLSWHAVRTIDSAMVGWKSLEILYSSKKFFVVEVFIQSAPVNRQRRTGPFQADPVL